MYCLHFILIIGYALGHLRLSSVITAFVFDACAHVILCINIGVVQELSLFFLFSNSVSLQNTKYPELISLFFFVSLKYSETVKSSLNILITFKVV